MDKKAVCKITGKEFVIYEQEVEFCGKIGVPLPDIGPGERLRMIMATRNERKLYRRKCDATGEEIISAYRPDSHFKVYKNKIWWCDGWDACEYGRDFDFSKPFFEQFAELQKVVPREGTSVFNSENCDYNSHIRESKNCYLCHLVAKCEDMLYSHWVVETKDCADCINIFNSTLCYESGNLENCYNCVLLWDSTNSRDCYGSYQLKGCDHCLFCSNLVSASYRIYNEPCTKEQFDQVLSTLLNGSRQQWEFFYGKFVGVCDEAVHRAVHFINCENCTGDYLYSCRNCRESFQGKDNEDCYNSASLGAAKDVYSGYSVGWPAAELIYFGAVVRGCHDCAFCTYCWFSNGLRYCDSCNSCENCFGCIGLRHKKYCILNKQYTKEEYEKLLPKIVAAMGSEWGEFFPAKLAIFAYNETAAQDYFPLTKEEVLARGWKWVEKDKNEYRPASVKELPEKIEEVGEDILKAILACEKCGRNYKIVLPELKFYRKMKLPLPRECPECRHQRRFERVNPYQLFARECAKCRKGIQSSYAPGRKEVIFCEECYLKKIY